MIMIEVQDIFAEFRKKYCDEHNLPFQLTHISQNAKLFSNSFWLRFLNGIIVTLINIIPFEQKLKATQTIAQ